MNKRTAAQTFSVQQSFFDSQGVYPPFPVGIHLGKDGPQRLDLGAEVVPEGQPATFRATASPPSTPSA